MGLNASSDEWCRQSDIIIAGLPYAMKIVDDTIIWAATESELEERVPTVVQRCADNNITISRKKFELGNSIQQGESSDEDANEASALAVSSRISNASPVYRC